MKYIIFFLILTFNLYGNILHVNNIFDIKSVNTKLTNILYLDGYYSFHDGGEGYFKWDNKINKKYANGGTIIDPNVSLKNQGNSKGRGCWIRQDSGFIKTEWFGIKTDGSDTTKEFLNLIKYIRYNHGGIILLPPKTIYVNNLDFTGCNNTTILGHGKLSTIDFKYANNGIGINFGSKKGLGGTQHIKLSNFSLTNSGKSKLNSLLEFRSGKTKQQPIETSGFITLKNIFFDKGAKKALSLVGVSHVLGESLNMKYHTSIDYALYISQDVDINTGVFTFTNCIFRGRKTALVIEATHQLIDTILFQGCGFFNYYNPSSREVIVLNGKKCSIESVKFIASHIESRNSNKNEKVAIAFKGKLQSINFDTIHLSCGTSNINKQADYAFMFYNYGKYKELSFNNISVLRCKNEGYVFYIEGVNSIFYIKNKINIKGLVRNITNPSLLKKDFNKPFQYLTNW